MAGRFREDAHDSMNALLDQWQQKILGILNSPELGFGEVEQLVAAWPARDPALAEALHGSVDSGTWTREFAEGSREKWRQELDTIARQIGRRRAEMALRESEREAVAAEQRKQQAEERLAEIAG
jgi:hypothetical protein